MTETKMEGQEAVEERQETVETASVKTEFAQEGEASIEAFEQYAERIHKELIDFAGRDAAQ